MSIIHDALKKVQQGLNPKSDASAYIYENPPAVESLPPADKQAAKQKPPVQNQIKSIFAMICALAVTVLSIVYIWQQVQNKVPQVRVFAKKSFYQLIHKQGPDSKNKTPENLKPLAQLTINPSAAKSSSKPGPITLDVHGIMANASGNLVLINDQVYQEGDEVDGAKIVKIDLDSIKIINNGTEETIFVKN